MQNPQQIEETVGALHRKLVILWFGQFGSMCFLLGLTLYVPTDYPEPNTMLSFALIGTAFTVVVLSVLIKQRVVHRAIEQRDTSMMQTGYVVGLVVCEAAALLGIVNHFVTGSSYYYISFALGLLGMLIHFPKKDHVRAAIG